MSAVPASSVKAGVSCSRNERSVGGSVGSASRERSVRAPRPSPTRRSLRYEPAQSARPASTGGVSKRVFTYERPVDPGLADWAASYLNEALVGKGLGARTLRSRLTDPTLPPTERSFLEGLAPAFTELAETAEESLYVEGTARLLSEHRFQDVSQLNALLDMLERRVSLLGLLSAALDQRELYVRIGDENEAPALRGLSLVAANYGLPQRNLGTVSVIGPTRMDYATAIGAVRTAALELSRFVEDVYDAD